MLDELAVDKRADAAENVVAPDANPSYFHDESVIRLLQPQPLELPHNIP